MVALVSTLIASIDSASVSGSKRRGCRACTARRMFSPTLSAGNRLVIWNERPMPAVAISSGVRRAVGDGDIDTLHRPDAAKTLEDVMRGEHRAVNVNFRPQEFRQRQHFDAPRRHRG